MADEDFVLTRFLAPFVIRAEERTGFRRNLELDCLRFSCLEGNFLEALEFTLRACTAADYILDIELDHLFAVTLSDIANF